MVAGSIATQVYKELKKNPLLTAKPLCKILDLPWEKYKRYVAKLRCIWRKLPRDKQGLKPSSFHNWHGFVFAPKLVNRALAVGAGWLQTKAKNHYLLFKNKLGRLEWHMNGRIRVWIRKPVNAGKAFQLLADGFFSSGLITDIKVFEAFAKSLRFKGASAVFESDQELPHMVIDLFEVSNGIRIKVGDRSHPRSVEVDYWIPDWGEKVERLLERLADSLGPKKNGKVEPGDTSFIV